MRRTVLLAAACLLGITGCSSGGASEGASKTTASASASPSTDPIVRFVRSVEDAHFASYADGIPAYQELEVFPPKWCAALGEGHSVEWMLGDGGGLYPIGQDWGTEKGDAYQLVLLGVEAYCPKYAGQVKQELRDAGAY